MGEPTPKLIIADAKLVPFSSIVGQIAVAAEEAAIRALDAGGTSQ